MKKLKCNYCNKEKEEFSFKIGASLKPDWTMHEGTGKIACPDCHHLGVKEGQEAIDKHVKTVAHITSSPNRHQW